MGRVAAVLEETSKQLRTATTPRLNRRAWHGSVGAVNAAVPRFRLQSPMTRRALPEELARIGRHSLLLLEAAVRAREDGNILNPRPPPREDRVPHAGSDQCRHPAINGGAAGRRVVIREHGDRAANRENQRVDLSMSPESEKRPDHRNQDTRLNRVAKLERELLQEGQAQNRADRGEQRKATRRGSRG